MSIDALLLLLDGSRSGSIDLSRATKLKDVVFRPTSRTVEWITTTLQTTTPKHRDLRHITIHMPDYLTLPSILADIRGAVGAVGYGEWLDLDRLLVQLWESRSIHPRIGSVKGQDVRDLVGYLLPEIAKRNTSSM